MKKNFLIRANVLLGALSLLLAGCHSTKKAAEKSALEAADEPQQAAAPSDRVVCMYGVPPQVYEQQRAKEEEEMRRLEQQRQDSLQSDTLSGQPGRVMLKYGVPYPRQEKK